MLAEGSSWKANLPRSSRFRSASSLSCTRCWPWQGTVLKVISALGLELHVTAWRRGGRGWRAGRCRDHAQMGRVKGSGLQGCQRPAPRGDGLENSIPT